ncbi:hypothetical protein QUF79_24315 [Fictibacillus enclensis]|nr:hypothetical protein [Fictibacillus enclensis]MDM5201153.1 hypothetical protein [Fictibacillus enclensis]
MQNDRRLEFLQGLYVGVGDVIADLAIDPFDRSLHHDLKNN